MRARLLFDAPIGTDIPWPFLVGHEAAMTGGLQPSQLLCCVLVNGSDTRWDGTRNKVTPWPTRYECEFDLQGVAVAKMVYSNGKWRLLCVSREGELR